MKILIIKYTRDVPGIIKRLTDTYPVVAICDPDLSGRVLAHHDLPSIPCYIDPSLAIRKSGCDTVLLTISDHAAQLALLAIAYNKDVLLAKGVNFGKDTDRVYAAAAKANGVMSL
jgi:hypothetical protein